MRVDRNRHGGGLLLYISDKITYNIVTLGPCNLELLAVCLDNKSCKCCLCLFYRPPCTAPSIFATLFDVFVTFKFSLYSHLIFIGDFNVDFCNQYHPLF